MSLQMSGLILDVQDNDFKGLVFHSEKFDSGLGKNVECSLTVGVSKEHLHLLPEYKKLIGQHVNIPVVALPTKKGGIFLITGSNGLPA